jgi:hypothetical protein
VSVIDRAAGNSATAARSEASKPRSRAAAGWKAEMIARVSAIASSSCAVVSCLALAS